MIKIEVVDWQITSSCNRCCPYCFGPKNIPDISLHDAFKIVDLLKNAGTRQIGITGGEPTLFPFFPELINYIFQSGIRIYLSSNCDNYDIFSSLIKSKIDILGVPLDSGDPLVHDQLRGDGSFSTIIHALDDINESRNCPVKIKIGTVVTNKNYMELDQIEKTLIPYRDRLLYWKLYELVCYPRNIGALKLSVDFSNVSNNLGQFIGKDKVIYDTLSMRDRSYFFIDPKGDVFIPLLSSHYSKELFIGNIVSDDINSIVEKFNNIVFTDGYYSIYRYMRYKQ